MLQRCRAQKLSVATFNLGQSGTGRTDPIHGHGHRLNELMDAMDKISFHVVGLAETHAKEAQRRRWKEGRLRGTEIHIGRCETGQNNSTIGGVGFIVHESVTTSIHSIDLTSSRIGVLKLNVAGQRLPLKILQVYAPHSGYSDEDHEQFYAEVQAKLAEPACRTIVMGDFNARTGSGTADELYIGRFSAETRNDAGQRMVSFAEANKLYVMNSFFEKPRQKRWTWQSADGVTRSELDYVLCDDRQTVHNVEMLSRFEARSDHKIVRATLLLDLPKMKRDRALAARRKLPKAISERVLQAKIEGAQWQTDTGRINERYEALETTLLKCLKEAEVRKPQCREPRITEETKNLMIRLQWLKLKNDQPEECRRLSHEVRQRLVADYESYKNRRLMETAEARRSLKQCKRSMAQTQLVSGSLRDEHGELQTEREAVEDTCRRFYTSLFESKVPVARVDAAEPDDASPPPAVTAEEIEVALKKFKNGKAPGPDGITAEMLKSGGHILWQHIAKFFTHCLRNKRIPLAWKESRTVLLHKKGDTEDLKNYRPICLLPVLYKLFTKIIVSRIGEQLDAAQPHEQAGFRSGYSTSDHMQTLNQIQERAREKGMRLYLVFIDYEKAFDSIEINAVLNALEKQGVNRSYIDVLEDVYDGCTTQIKLFHREITIPIGRGVRQGDTISPKLFTAALEEVFKELGWEDRNNCGIVVDGRRLN